MINDESTAAFLGGFFGSIIGAILVFIVMFNSINDTARRALSCMANGNTIAQCETVLGISAR